MLRITIVCVGKLKEKYFADAVAEYGKRLGRYCRLEIAEVADEKTPDGASAAEEEVLARADFRLSFSRLTFPHQLMRVVLLEQIYRSFRINLGEPYHKEMRKRGQLQKRGQEQKFRIIWRKSGS